MINPDHYVHVPIEKLPDLVRGAYDRSRPVGLGFLHAEPGPLPEEELQLILEYGAKSPNTYVYMDYVKGRCCKFSVWRHLEDPSVGLVENRWYDHTHSDLVGLLTDIGLADPEGQIEAAQRMQERDRASV